MRTAALVVIALCAATGIGVAYTFAPNASVILGFVDTDDAALDDTVATQVDINC